MNAENPSAHKPQGGEKADAAAWLAVAAGTIGALMATLDTSIVNAALPTIQGEIGASGSEGTWISTAYLVAEIIMIPLSGWLEKVFGLRSFLLVMTVLFVSFSMLCGVSGSLGTMIVGRVGQGFTGGAMIPTALSIVSTRLPPAQRPVGVALFGLTAVLGPVLGPLVGGWLTENVSWHYSFFLNLPIGIGLVVLLLVGLPHKPAPIERILQGDWLGIVGLAVGLGCLTIVLEEGQREQWFESSFIVWFSVLAAFGFVLIVLGQLTAREPVIDMSILFTRSFGSVFLMSFAIGGALYGILYIIPQFLSQVPRYNSEQSGYVVLISGIPTLALMPFFPMLVRLLDIRVAIGFGILCYATSCFMESGLTTEDAGPQFVSSQLLRGVGQAFSLLFLNQAAATAVSRDKAEDASGLFNGARNLGGSFGLALISTLQQRRDDFHNARLEESVRANSVIVQDRIDAMVGSGGPEAMRLALSGVKRMISAQATVMSFSDLYFVFGWILLAVLPLVLFLRPPPKGGPVATH
ncbi:DHA2 family efflux MFS transporter permease subunit [Methylobacterium sp. V23]|uniref:DHA2 family efflux MFS transporter permease subunit n=1 Tax=Methylobacterium sp. V23 TaxID=2044878 RepID=UPI001FE13C53|nr:DHA2 family efflux MFS transporter permease subunit [Methylobacterium sp. V23]